LEDTELLNAEYRQQDLDRIKPNHTLLMSRALNLNISSQGQLMNSDTSPARLRFLVEYFIIDHVDGSKVIHVRQEYVDFDDVVDAASGRIQNGAEIGQGLSLIMR
jgi:hypothetical protein